MTLLPLTLSLGCLSDLGHRAPSGYTMEVGGSVTLVWDSSYNDYDDGLGALVPIDVMVMDNDGNPAPDIRVEFITGSSGVYLLPEAAIQEVDPPNPEAEGSNCTPGAEDYDIETCAWYDSDNERYFELSTSYTGDYKPNYAIAASDEFGTVRMWAYVDALGTTGDESSSFLPTGITVSLGHTTSQVTIESSSS